MKLKIVLSICCNYDMYYCLTYEGVAHTVKGDAGLVAFLKRRFSLDVEEGFRVADQFLDCDELVLDMCFSQYC